MQVTRYTDSEGQAWEIEQQDVFGEPWNPDIIDEVFGKALVKVRRAGEHGGVRMRAPGQWNTQSAMAQIVAEAKVHLHRSGP